MNWFRENPFVSSLLTVAVIGVLGLGYLLSTAMSSYQESLDTYGQAVQKLQKLQNHVPFPSKENLEKVTEQRNEYVSKADALQERLAQVQLHENKEVTPVQFQDNLRAEVNKLSDIASAAKVLVPANFNLGFEYLTSPPTQEAAPALDRQLKFISQTLQSLLGSNPDSPIIISLDSIERPLLAEESGVTTRRPAAGTGRRPAGASNTNPSRPDGAAQPGRNSPVKFQQIPFTVAFTADQSKFRTAFNTLVEASPFTVVRSLTVKNSRPEAPGKETAVATDTQRANDIFGPSQPGSPEAPKSLNVIFGKEVLNVRMTIEMIDFQLPETNAPVANSQTN